jgi:pimeloyl-ACP methyl ester carboxylesterase
MPFFKIGDLKFFYEVKGVGSCILLLPPLLKDHEFLEAFAEPLAKNYSIISFDPLGHGSSDKPKSENLYSYENLADCCYKLIEHLKISKHDIVGISWSGRIALTYTIQHPEKVRALILIGSSGPKHHPMLPPQMTENLSDIEKFVTETVWKTPYDVTADMKRIHSPTLILIGDQDPRLDAARLMHTSISKSTLHILKGLGHAIPAEICVSNILSWLQKIE